MVTAVQHMEAHRGPKAPKLYRQMRKTIAPGLLLIPRKESDSKMDGPEWGRIRGK